MGKSLPSTILKTAASQFSVSPLSTSPTLSNPTVFALSVSVICFLASPCFSLSLWLSLPLPNSIFNFLMGYEMNRRYQYFVPFVSNYSDKNNQHKIKLKTNEMAPSKTCSIDYKLAEESNFLDNMSAAHLTWGNGTR